MRRHATAARRGRRDPPAGAAAAGRRAALEGARGVLGLRQADGYPALLERLARAARDQLGPDADVEVDPPGLGGVIGRAGRTSVDYTLPALVDRSIAALGDELERLWR